MATHCVGIGVHCIHGPCTYGTKISIPLTKGSFLLLEIISISSHNIIFSCIFACLQANSHFNTPPWICYLAMIVPLSGNSFKSKPNRLGEGLELQSLDFKSETLEVSPLNCELSEFQSSRTIHRIDRALVGSTHEQAESKWLEVIQRNLLFDLIIVIFGRWWVLSDCCTIERKSKR